MCEVDHKDCEQDLSEKKEPIKFSDLRLIFDNLRSLFEKQGYLINWKEFEKQDLSQTINTLAMASPFTLEEKQMLLETKNLNYRKEKLEQIINTYLKDNFSNKSGLLVYKGFRSICPVTSQPDWGNIFIYSSTNTLNKKEIYNFLFSLRNHGGFHEHCVEKIFLYIKETFSVDHIEICGRFLRRGGIDINPIRSSQKKLFFANFREFNQ